MSILTEDEHNQLILFIEKYGLNFSKLSSLLKHSSTTLETHFYEYSNNTSMEFNIKEQLLLIELNILFENQWNLITETFNSVFIHLNNFMGIKRTKKELINEFYKLIKRK